MSEWVWNQLHTKASGGVPAQALLAVSAPAGAPGVTALAAVEGGRVRQRVLSRLRGADTIRRYRRLRAAAAEAQARVSDLQAEAAALEARREGLLSDLEPALPAALAELTRRQADLARELAEASAVASSLGKELAAAAGRAGAAVRECHRVENAVSAKHAVEGWAEALREPVPPEVARWAERLAALSWLGNRAAFDAIGPTPGELLEELAGLAEEAAVEAEAVGAGPG
jgi:hypothetical protein